MLTIDQQKIHLQNVSRTFALTIPVLPITLSDYVGLAYLVCRIIDTIEDDPKLSIESKSKELRTFSKVLQGEIDKTKFTEFLLPKLTCSEKEYLLMKDIPLVINRLNSYPEEIKKIIKKAASIMCLGMEYHVINYKINSHLDLDMYCYSVAGVVGQMLAELFSKFSNFNENIHKELFKLSVSFGEGLQLTNILKDIWDDSSRNILWLPINNEQFSSLSDLEKIQLINNEISISMGHLKNAILFILTIPIMNQGVRKFCIWAVAMAILTLRKIYLNPLFTDSKQIKISRKDVKKTIMLTSIFSLNNILLRLYFKKLMKGLPITLVNCEELNNNVSKW